jgi:hypothetical protein
MTTLIEQANALTRETDDAGEGAGGVVAGL